ncbi:GTP pyrophosphokinase [Microbacter margulisiae]|uniref:PpGpp synthetase/RelA/SpoT-type nucleotidyltransferase n=1 Tax=Microbacter margulisiae TaxID=1350067 RepID=A0A7W5H1D4_9PORP|nr:(p)ppGpp synthetase [Microbacter margulisiae]MBB3186242.1 ppGpp synthetase/RelA/SpoT-type nucleotidyltransferase [Microbacter margulisiae]
MDIFEKKTEDFTDWYLKQSEFHDEAIRFFVSLISSFQKVESVRGRVKDKNECISKFKRKYMPIIDTKETNYEIKTYITDLIGIRAICLYSNDVNQIRRDLKKYFHEVDITDKSGQLEKTEDKFGYKSLHLQLVLKNRLNDVPDYKRFRKLQFELQIRTIIQDAWSILDHKIKYKKSIPQNLKRRINRLSALFEIADDEFFNIQKEISQEEIRIHDRIKKGGRIEKTKNIDVFRFLFVVLKYFPEYNFIEYKVDGFVDEILSLKQNFTEGELNDALEKHLSFADKIEQKIKQRLNPYTKIRYCLFKLDSVRFESLLTIHQTKIINSMS